MEEYMESDLSGIFRVKLLTKNIVRGSPGTQFKHMRVNIFLSLENPCIFLLTKKRPENPFLILTVNYRKICPEK